jgi:hypothetical protein
MHCMQTHLTQSPPLLGEVVPLPPTSKANWTTDDESALIAFLVEHKAEAKHGTNFKTPVWNAAAKEIAKSTSKGGPKSVDSYKLKWAQVHSSIVAKAQQGQASTSILGSGSVW